MKKKHSTLKELQEKRYQFSILDLSGMLNDLLEKEIIKAGRTVDPKYCGYHKVVSHPLDKCMMLKERII